MPTGTSSKLQGLALAAQPCTGEAANHPKYSVNMIKIKLAVLVVSMGLKLGNQSGITR